jgi:hypothetical protein
LIVKAPKHVVPMLVALMLAAMLGGCSKHTTPTGLDTTLDQAPPAIPAQITAETGISAGSAALNWTASSSANAAGYEIYQYLPSPKSANAYALIGQTDVVTTTYSLPWAPPQTTRYYRLRTVSSTGVKSELSAFVTVSNSSSWPAGGPAPGEPMEPGVGVKTKP